ncbi:MAG: glutathione S-transferase family protein [Caulobacteraceae bacterium]
MADDLVFYTNPMSRGRIVRWMLEEVGQPYRTEMMQYDNLKSPDYLAINPMGKLPAIVHRGVVVTECAAICAYLADAFPQAGLAPPVGDAARGPYYRWLFFTAGPLEQAVTNKSLGFVVPEERERMVGYGNVDHVTDTLEKAVTGRDYLAGDAFSAADLYVGAQIGWGLAFGTIEKRPAFEAYAERVNNRPAAVRAREIDDGLIAAAKAAGG